MSLPETIQWCLNHNSQALDGECWFWLTGQVNGPCRIVALPVAGPDDLVIRRDDDGNWPEFAITTLAAAFINNERGVGQHPDVVLDLLAAAEEGEE